jgi:N-acyl-L-homoserine lactone synthetase
LKKVEVVHDNSWKSTFMQNALKQLQAVFCTEEQNPNVVDQLFQFRKELFVDALCWDLLVEGARERDQFDTGSAVHCALFRNGTIIAGFRAIRTDEPYLAKLVFPQLATIVPYPQRHDVWEISRFGVLPSEAGSITAQILYSLMFRFAHYRQANALVALTDLRHERFLTWMGVRTRRYGLPQCVCADENGAPLLAVAGDIPIANQRGRRFGALLKLVDNVEIDDETLVLRSDRLSA